jgi:cytochrome c oxidase accessory protein FixG
MNLVGVVPRAPEAAASGFYAAAQKIYPREVKGRFASQRKAAVLVLLGMFYGAAWLQWNGRQALLFDLPARRFYIFGLTLWPQDFFYMALLMIIAALSLFFVTAIAGRVWCGFACPQTVWTELFIWIEQWTEGTRSQRIKLDQEPWTPAKVLRKSSKQLLWVALAVHTGFTFVGYFSPIRALGSEVLSLTLGPWETFWAVFYGLATYGNAGFLREQVCKYMCPYARFQSAMFDQDTLIISYDQTRGEPRGARRRGSQSSAQGLGDCIDCTLCVQACPTGIDIRRGLQYECIACAACIDACDEVMDKVGSPLGLIRYTTEHAMQGTRTHNLRLRIMIYALLLLIGFGVLLYLLITRTPLILDVIRDRNALFREVHGDRIENAYTLKVINLDNQTHSYRLEVTGMNQLEIAAPLELIVVPPGTVDAIPARLQAPSTLSGGVHTINLTLRAVDAPRIAVREKARFIGPSH